MHTLRLLIRFGKRHEAEGDPPTASPAANPSISTPATGDSAVNGGAGHATGSAG